MKRWKIFLVACVLLLPQEVLLAKEGTCLTGRKGAASAYSSYDATAISMMLWGTGLAVGIALLSGLLRQSKASSSHAH